MNLQRLQALFVISVGSLLRGYAPRQAVTLLAQADLETGGFPPGENWWKDRNMFGMSEMKDEARRERLKGVRVTASGVKRAQFASLWDSAQDRFDWDKQQGLNINSNDYLEEMSSKYYGAEASYGSKVGSRVSDSLQRAYYLSVALVPVLLILILKWFKG